MDCFTNLMFTFVIAGRFMIFVMMISEIFHGLLQNFLQYSFGNSFRMSSKNFPRDQSEMSSSIPFGKISIDFLSNFLMDSRIKFLQDSFRNVYSEHFKIFRNSSIVFFRYRLRNISQNFFRNISKDFFNRFLQKFSLKNLFWEFFHKIFEESFWGF